MAENKNVGKFFTSSFPEPVEGNEVERLSKGEEKGVRSKKVQKNFFKYRGGRH
jgi:hypothetical protein